jgi:hypothetical protein
MSASCVRLRGEGGKRVSYLQSQVELAVLGPLNGADARSDVGLELVEAEGDDLRGDKSVSGCSFQGLGTKTYGLVGRDVGGHGALRAAVAGEGGRHDLDVLRVRGIGPAIVADDLSDGAGGDERGEEEGDGTHFGWWRPKGLLRSGDLESDWKLELKAERLLCAGAEEGEKIVLSMADTGLYIPFSRPGSWLRTLRNRLVQTNVHPFAQTSPRPTRGHCSLRRHIFRLRRQAAEASGVQREPLASCRLVSLICISRLMHPPSGTQRPAPARYLGRHSEITRGLHPGRKQSCLWWLVPRPRLFSHVRPLFVVRGSRQAKFADEVRINETHIKTGRTVLMARLNKVPSIRPDLRRDPSRLVFVAHSLTISHLLMRLILFIETRLQTLPCPVSPPIVSRPGCRHYRA